MKQKKGLISRTIEYLLELGEQPQTYICLLIYDVIIIIMGMCLPFVSITWTPMRIFLLAGGLILTALMNIMLVIYSMFVSSLANPELGEKFGIEEVGDEKK